MSRAENPCLECPYMTRTRTKMEEKADPITKFLIARFPGDWNTIVKATCRVKGYINACPNKRRKATA